MANKISLASSLTKFSGEENLTFFLNNLEQIANLEKWENNKKALILKLNLSGQALKIVSEAKLSVDNEYKDIIKILKDKFLTKLNFAEIQCNFNSLKQQANQSIKSLAEEWVFRHKHQQWCTIFGLQNDGTETPCVLTAYKQPLHSYGDIEKFRPIEKFLSIERHSRLLLLISHTSNVNSE